MTDFNELVRSAKERGVTIAKPGPDGVAVATSDTVTATMQRGAGPALTLTEAAARQGVHRRTVRGWIRDGRLPALRTPGGHYRVLAGDLDRLPMTTDDFAAAVGVCRRTVLRWCEAGKLAARKTGREWIIESGEVDRVGARPAPKVKGKPTLKSHARVEG